MRSDPSALPPESRSHPLYRIKSATDVALGWALVVLMGVSVVNVLWQVFTRFVLDNPSSFTDELARYLLIWVSLFGAAYASGKRMHLAIDLLAMRLTGNASHWHGLFIELCIGLFALFVMIVGGWQLVSLSFLLGQTSAAMKIPLGFVYLALPASGALILFYVAVFMAERSRLIRGRPPTLPVLMETTAEAYAENVDVNREGPDETPLTHPEGP